MSDRDNQRRAYEARIWRLAFLLTGHPVAANQLIARVLRAQPDVLAVEAVRLDRLVILQSREWAARHARAVAASPPLDAVAAEVLTAALGLNHQLLEAWTLARVDGMEGLSVSRAMDCSNTAVANHLAEADREMAEQLGAKLAPGLEALRKAADGLDPRPFIEDVRQRHKTRSRRRLIAMALILVAAFIALWASGLLGSLRLPAGM